MSDLKTNCMDCRTSETKMIEDVSFGFGDSVQINVCAECLARACSKAKEQSYADLAWSEEMDPFEAIEEDYNLKTRAIQILRFGALPTYY